MTAILPEKRPPIMGKYMIIWFLGKCLPSDRANSTPLKVEDRPMNTVARPMPKIPARTIGLRPITSSAESEMKLNSQTPWERTGQPCPLVYRDDLSDGKAAFLGIFADNLASFLNTFPVGKRETVDMSTYHEAAVEPDLGSVVGQVEVVHHLVHVGEDLSEHDGVDEPDDAQGCELGLGERGHLGGRSRFLVFQGAVVVKGVIIVKEAASLLMRRLRRPAGGRTAVEGHGAWSGRWGQRRERGQGPGWDTTGKHIKELVASELLDSQGELDKSFTSPYGLPFTALVMHAFQVTWTERFGRRYLGSRGMMMWTGDGGVDCSCDTGRHCIWHCRTGRDGKLAETDSEDPKQVEQV